MGRQGVLLLNFCGTGTAVGIFGQHRANYIEIPFRHCLLMKIYSQENSKRER